MASKESEGPSPPEVIQPTTFDLPGYTLPLQFTPPFDNPSTALFRNALDVHSLAGCSYAHDDEEENAFQVDRIRANREVMMLRVMNLITDNPDWENWVCDVRGMIFAMLFEIDVEDIMDDQDDKDNEIQNQTMNLGITFAMKEFLMTELRWRALEFENTKSVTVFDALVKSDTKVSSDLREALVSAADLIQQSRAVRKAQTDGSSKIRVVDPFLFPLIYGRSKILPAKHISLGDCASLAGTGVTLRKESENLKNEEYDSSNGTGDLVHNHPWYDPYFQQLPCEVVLSEKGCQITSYINNVHPAQHAGLYAVIEKIIEQALPMLTETLNYHLVPKRIALPEDPGYFPLEMGSEAFVLEDSGFAHWRQSSGTALPEPDNFRSWREQSGEYLGEQPQVLPRFENPVDLWTKLQERGLQVIVKVESLELTPENANLAAGEWHLEGAPNEHICATAVYCYEATNITPMGLCFRQRYDFGALADMGGMYGTMVWTDYLATLFPNVTTLSVRRSEVVTQVLGTVEISQGRLLTYPNVFQRRRSGFELIDESKPGHCKILYLHLVDPNIRIISTANVPPQREDWCEDRAAMILKFLHSKFPRAVVGLIVNELEDEMDPPMSMANGRSRKRHMEISRKQLRKCHNDMFERGTLMPL